MARDPCAIWIPHIDRLLVGSAVLQCFQYAIVRWVAAGGDGHDHVVLLKRVDFNPVRGQARVHEIGRSSGDRSAELIFAGNAFAADLRRVPGSGLTRIL